MSSRRGVGGGGGKRGIGQDFDIFPKKLMSNSLPPGKNVRSNITKFPTPGNDLWSRAQKKFKYPYPQDRKIIQMPYPRDKAIDQNPALCPTSPPPSRQLDIDRCIMRMSLKTMSRNNLQKSPKRHSERPGDLTKNLETPGKTGRVGMFARYDWNQ